MKRLSRNKSLNNVLQFGEMLLFEASGGVLGQKVEATSEIPFTERMKLFTALQDSVLLKHKVDPKKDSSGLSDLREMLKDDEEKSVVPLAVDNEENSERTEINGSRGKPSVNGSAPPAAFFSLPAPHDETPIQ